jgi:predicted DNA-binding ribbon-helix-helix protein
MSSVVKRSVILEGHKTSVSLEDAFWSEQKEIAGRGGVSLGEVLRLVNSRRGEANLSTAIRIFVFNSVKDRERAPQSRESQSIAS